MGCPQCQSDDINEFGKCLACGYAVSPYADAPETEFEPEDAGRESASLYEDGEMQSPSGLIEMDYSEGEAGGAPEEEKPSWRQELSQRLQAIKEKRQAMDPSRQAEVGDRNPPASPQRTSRVQPASPAAAKPFEPAPAYKPARKPKTPPPRQKTLQPLDLGLSEAKPDPKATLPRDVQALIDSAVRGKPQPAADPAAFAGNPAHEMDLSADDEGKLILLSRTLSGLVDFIIVLLSSGLCIIAADFFSGIIALDTISYLIFSVLLLLTYFCYSLYFLSASNQTVGMMITDLRVIDAAGGRPSVSQLLRRCFGYLASVLVLGFGLLWGLFDRESQCFHDRISDTRVVRFE